MPPALVAAGPTPARFPFWTGREIRPATCRLRPWRQVPRVAWGACRHGSFDNSFGRWSFLTFHPTKWSVLSKIRAGRWSTTAFLPAARYSTQTRSEQGAEGEGTVSRE